MGLKYELFKLLNESCIDNLRCWKIKRPLYLLWNICDFFSSCSILPRLILKWSSFPKVHIDWAAKVHVLCYLAGRNGLGLKFGHQADNLNINKNFLIPTTRLMVRSGLKDSICNKICFLRWLLYSFKNIEHNSCTEIYHLILLIILREIS